MDPRCEHRVCEPYNLWILDVNIGFVNIGFGEHRVCEHRVCDHRCEHRVCENPYAASSVWGINGP